MFHLEHGSPLGTIRKSCLVDRSIYRSIAQKKGGIYLELIAYTVEAMTVSEFTWRKKTEWEVSQKDNSKEHYHFNSVVNQLRKWFRYI